MGSHEIVTPTSEAQSAAACTLHLHLQGSGGGVGVGRFPPRPACLSNILCPLDCFFASISSSHFPAHAQFLRCLLCHCGLVHSTPMSRTYEKLTYKSGLHTRAPSSTHSAPVTPRHRPEYPGGIHQVLP